ncbi:MAG: SdpI family protein [Lachnospiraceae bacterium]|nr:SdpI family protein [Lachnospiraceae bacterium]
MIRKHKTQILLSSLLILLPLVIGFFLWHMLPEQIATHWNIDGSPDGWSGLGFAIFSVPVILFVFHWICILITAHDTKNQSQSSKVFCMVLWILPIISLTTSSMIYAQALGMDIHIGTIARILFALLFLFLGNYMPKCRQNSTIGVKIRWTLKNEENWNKTHRFTGRLWMLGGIFFLISLVFPFDYFIPLFVIALLLLAFLPMLYSYIYYRKQLKAGTLSKADILLTPQEKKSSALSITIGSIILVFTALFLETGNIQLQYDTASFTIQANYWKDVTILYEDIEQIEYRTQDKPGMRTFGYGSFKLLMGEFENQEFGNYTRYSYIGCDSCVVLTVKGRIFVINGKDTEATEKIYQELSSRT